MIHLASIAAVLWGCWSLILTLTLTLILCKGANPRSIIFCEGANTNFIWRRLEGANPRSESANSGSINFM